MEYCDSKGRYHDVYPSAAQRPIGAPQSLEPAPIMTSALHLTSFQNKQYSITHRSLFPKQM